MSTPEITGNTLRVYLQLLKHGPCELRDVQHGIGLSTASLASYHLTKLVRAGYAKQDELGRYVTTGESAGDILAGYTKIGPAIIPQIFFFSLLFTILAVFFSYEVLYGNNSALYLIAVSLSMIAVLWYETIRLWRRLIS